MAKPLHGDNEAQLDELGNDPGQVGPGSAGQSGDSQRLSSIADAAEESVQELAESDQALEAALVEGVEDASDHPERPAHTHLEYGHPDDLPPREDSDIEVLGSSESRGTRGEEINLEELAEENLPDEESAA